MHSSELPRDDSWNLHSYLYSAIDRRIKWTYNYTLSISVLQRIYSYWPGTKYTVNISSSLMFISTEIYTEKLILTVWTTISLYVPHAPLPCCYIQSYCCHRDSLWSLQDEFHYKQRRKVMILILKYYLAPHKTCYRS